MAKTKKVSLALQGGGSHGAFAWGVIDRLMELPDIHIDGLVGTSAGAMNAAITAYGMHIGGKQGAKDLLEKFWHKISEVGKTSPLQPTWVDKMFSHGDMDFSPTFWMFTMMTDMYSPYEFNPLNYNPLRNILLELIDFERLKSCTYTKLFVCATNVRTIRRKVFSLQEMSVDALLASACLPFLYQTVEIDGEAYWDGGYLGNPAMMPLIENTDTQDILLIKINPVFSEVIPKNSKDIQDRVNEISFNASLMWEMRYIDLKNRLVREGLGKAHQWREVFFHAISADKALIHLGYSSKLNTSWDFLLHLKEIGRKYADEWIENNYDRVGKETTYDVVKNFL